jgi:hypothetical protein
VSLAHEPVSRRWFGRELRRGAIVAADFFIVAVRTMCGLVRHGVLFGIDLTTRCVQVARITRQPDGAWMDRMTAHLSTPCTNQ